MLFLYAPFILIFFSFFFNDTATTEIYTLSLHDALPISRGDGHHEPQLEPGECQEQRTVEHGHERSEEHTSELQSLRHLVCRLLLEKKKKRKKHREKTKKKAKTTMTR